MTDLSILIPVYGVETYIRRCAEALFSQTLKDGVELIFVDDASPDRSSEIIMESLERFPERKDQVKLIRHERNRGVAAARLTALNVAEGKYIIYCDSDDWTDPEMYADMLKRAKETDADIVTCDYIGEFAGKSITYSQQTEGDILNFRRKLLSGHLHNGLWNKMIRRELIERIENPFCEGHNYWEDVALTCRLAHLAISTSHIDRAYYHYFQGNVSAYTRNISDSSISNMIESCRIVTDFYSACNDADIYKKSLLFLKGRTLYSALSHSSRERHDNLIATLDPQHQLRGDEIPAGRIDRLAFRLFLQRKDTAAASLLRLKNIIKRLLR